MAPRREPTGLEVAHGLHVRHGDTVWIWRRGKWEQGTVVGHTVRVEYAAGATTCDPRNVSALDPRRRDA